MVGRRVPVDGGAVTATKGDGGGLRIDCALARRLVARSSRSEIEKMARQTELAVETGTERDCRLGQATASSSQDVGSATDPCDNIENVDG